MKITENKIYKIYILLGLFYFVSKLIYFIPGWVCFSGLILGLIASLLTIFTGIFSLKEYSKSSSIGHWLAIIIPLIILIYSPLHMVIKLGIPVFQFPIEKFTILLIFEGIAITQLILSIIMHRKLRFFRINGGREV